MNIRQAFHYYTDKLRGRLGVGGALTVYPDDTYLVSYPKSGNTWLRFLVANLMVPNHEVSFSNIETIIPDIYVFPDRHLKGFDRPRILKSHETFDPRYRTAVVLVRDPRAVAASYYQYHRKMGLLRKRATLSQFVTRFIEGDLELGSWRDNVLSWVDAPHSAGSLHFTKYEALMADPANELQAIAKHLSLPQSPDAIRHAIDNSQAERMRKLEQRDASSWIGARRSSSNIPFVRSANADGWKAELTERDADRIVEAFGDAMERFGY